MPKHFPLWQAGLGHAAGLMTAHPGGAGKMELIPLYPDSVTALTMLSAQLCSWGSKGGPVLGLLRALGLFCL